MSQTVLVADDSKTIRQIVEMALKASSWEVVGVDSAQDAMQAARQSPSVILLDYYMPDGSGYDVCRALKQDAATRQIPIVMLGGSYQAFDEDRARESGADVVLMKPFKTDALLNALEDAQNAETALPVPAMPAAPEPEPEPTPATIESEPELALDSEPEEDAGYGYGYGEDSLAEESSDPIIVAAPASDPVYELPMDDDEDDLPRPGGLSRPTPTPTPPTPTPPPAHTPTPTPAPAATPTPTPAPPAEPARGSSPSIQARPDAVGAGLSRDEIETLINNQVKAAVKNELPGLLRNVMAEIFQQKIMPKLTEHADARIQATLNNQLTAQIQQQVRAELERLLNED